MPGSVFRSVLFLLILVAGFGCSDPTSSNPGPGSPPPDPGPGFSARATGGVERDLEGTALFSTDAPGEEYGFTVALLDSSAREGEIRHAIYLLRERTGLPDPGEYELGDSGSSGAAFLAGVVLDGDGEDPLLCEEVRGTLEIRSATATRLEGGFHLEASCAHVDGRPVEAVVITGTFVSNVGVIGDPAARHAMARSRWDRP